MFLVVICFFMLSSSFDSKCSTKHVDMICGDGEGCVENKCGVCVVDKDCGKEYHCSENKCVHVKLLPLSSGTVWALILSLIISVLGGSTGVGGGALIVPVLGILCHFKPITAVGLSQAAILGNGISAFIVGLKSRHPKRNRPRVYFDVLFVFIPSIMVGCFLGVFVGPLFPSYAITLILAILLVMLTIRNSKRTATVYKKEKEIKQQSKNKTAGAKEEPDVPDVKTSSDVGSVDEGAEEGFTGDIGDESLSPSASTHTSGSGDGEAGKKTEIDMEEGEGGGEFLVGSQHEQKSGRGKYISGGGPNRSEKGEESSDVEMGRMDDSPNLSSSLSYDITSSSSSSFSSIRGSELREIYRKEKRPPLFKTICILAVISLVVFVALARPSRRTASVFRVPRCGGVDWMIFALYVLASIGLTVFAAVYLYLEENHKKKLGYDFCEGDVHWTLKGSVFYPLCSFGTGIIASALGIGGAIITQPMLDSMGVLPIVVTATTSALLLASSLASFIQFFVAGIIPLDFVIAFFIMGIVGSFFGSFVVGKIVVHYQMSWLLFLLLTVFYVISIGMTGYYSIFSVILLWGSKTLYTFSSPCG